MTEKNAFHLLHPKVKELALKRFKNPTPVQREVIPQILKGKDTLVISETGSGKTESCLLPLFDHLLEKPYKPISVLYITPLKSLNRDLWDRILWWANRLSFEVSVRHGDTSQYERKMQAENPPHMLISTPETLQAILTGKKLREHLKNIRHIVIDEIHELVDNKRGNQLSIGLERLKRLIGKTGGHKPQLLGLSATVGSPEEVARFLSPEAEVVDTERTTKFDIKVTSPGISPERKKDRTGVETRLDFIAHRVREKKSTLVFTNTREAAEMLSSRLKNKYPDLPIDVHHSSLSKDVRIEAEDNFKEGKLKALLCTSSLELGIDIGNVDFTLQYNSPRQVSKLLQRVGRSGHTLQKTSRGRVIATSNDDCFEAAVISHMARESKIEPTDIYPKSMDVLGHQVIGLLIEDYRLPFNTALETIRKAQPYRDLSRDELFQLCLFLQRLGLLWVNTRDRDQKLEDVDYEDIILKRRRKAFEYYFYNLSTIPDVRSYTIFNTYSRQDVGTLDADFIALHGDRGVSFIIQGQPWRILDITEDKVFVEPVSSPTAAIPAWEGELIPVPTEVARGVGTLRRKISESKEPIKYLTQNYPVNTGMARKMAKFIQKQKILPTDKKIVLEYGRLEGDNYLVIHSCAGSMVNETIGRALSNLLADNLGSVALQTDPYRISFKMKQLSDWKEIQKTLQGLRPDRLEEILRMGISNSELFQWRFTHVAKRFGIISKDADYGKAYMRKIIKSYEGTPVYEETLNEIFQEKLDLEGASQFLKDLHQGKIETSVSKGLSTISTAGISRRYDLMGAEKPEEEIFQTFKDRLLTTRMGLLCTHCGNILTVSEVKDINNVICSECESQLVAPIFYRRLDRAREVLDKSLQNKKLTEEEQKRLDRLKQSASLVSASGPDAVKVLAGRGVGPETAGRILQKQNTGDRLLKDILQAERKFTQTRRFWKD